MQQASLAACVLLAILGLCTQRGEAVKAISEWNSGILTHYGGKQDKMDPKDPSFGSLEGACGFGEIPKDRWPFFSVGALATNSTFYKNDTLNGCGQCFQIQCQKDFKGGDACIKDRKGVPKSILVVITDECPECGEDHIDVQALNFVKVMNPDIGRANIRYRRIECTPPADMKVSVLDWLGGGRWLRLAIDDTGGRGSVSQVSVKSSGSKDWIPLENKWGAVWEIGTAPTPPLDFLMETDDGEEVLATEVIKQNGGIQQGAFAPRLKFDTGVQFTITDPAAQLVQAAAGPDEATNPDFDPMVATSDTPGNNDSANATVPASSVNASRSTADGVSRVSAGNATAANSSCVDVPAPGSSTCEQQKGSGKCKDMLAGGYCQLTCGGCPPLPAITSANSTAAGAANATAAGAANTTAAGAANTTAAAANATAGAANATATNSSCVDLPSPGSFTCEQQKGWGKCKDMLARGYCQLTCGGCSPSPAAASTNGTAAGAANATTGNTTATNSSCVDLPSPGSFTCEQQKGWGKCKDMLARGFCQLTCGGCQPAAGAANATAGAATAGAANATAGNATATNSSCVDLPSPGSFTCEQQKGWGKCKDMLARGYCQLTCGGCSASTATVNASSTAAGPAPSPPASPPPPSTSPVPAPGSFKNLSAASAPGPEPACQDVLPPGDLTCQQQKDYGKCGEGWLQPYCAATCGRCKSFEQGKQSPEPTVQSFSESSSKPGGRRLLS